MESAAVEDLIPASSLIQCGLPGCGELANLKACSRCKNQWYCGVNHQKEHWPVHKPVCKAVAASETKPSKDVTNTSARMNSTAPAASKITRYTLSDMPAAHIVTVYQENKHITIRHGYNFISKAVGNLFSAFKNDAYPPEDTEGLFGIQMNPANERVEDTIRPSLGNLVYLTWLAIWKDKIHKQNDEDGKALRNEVVMMILMGKYPEWFQLEVMEFAQSPSGSQNAYVHELLRRGLENITYDTMLYKFCWGHISQADIDFLVKTAD